jgi:DNA-binding CsgD family transcriptional regulator
VGRDAELDVAQQTLDEALAGDGRVLLVAGEPGIGKTRLVEELGGLAEDQGALLAWGRVDDVEGAPPYWQWMQLLDGVMAGIGRDVLADAVGSHAGVLSAIAPFVAELGIDVTPPVALDPAGARFRLHQAIVDVVRRLAGHRPLVLVLEDVHWADVASLELARFAAARLMGVPVMLVLTYRTVDAGDTELLHDVLGSLARQRALRRVALDGLSASEVGLFMAHTTGLRPRRTAIAGVHARTEGNPFFVGEIVRLGQSEWSERHGDDGAVPLGVRDVVALRLARLPQQTRELLAIGSVLGREFGIEMLAASAGSDEALAATALEPALAAGLLVDSAGRMRFSHALVRDTIYREMSSLRRATLHARVGDALERRQAMEGAPVAELAWHFAHAAPVLGPHRGLDYLLKAAEAARSALSFERAEDDLRRALTLVEMLPDGCDRWQRELDVQHRLIALIFFTQGFQAPAAADASARARWLCEQIGDTDELFGTLVRLGISHHSRGDVGVTLELGEQALTIGRRHGSAQWLNAGHQLVGMAQLQGGRLRAAHGSLAAARAAAASLPVTPEAAAPFSSLHPQVSARVFASRCAWLLGEARQARVFADEGVEIAVRVGLPNAIALAWFFAAHLDVLEGDASAVLELTATATAFCEEHGLYAGWFRLLRGWAVSELGRPDDGIAQMEAEVATYGTSRTVEPLLLRLLADGELRRGDAARALALVDQGLSEMGETVLWQSDLHRRRGELLAAQGPRHEAQARDELRKAVKIAEEQGAVALRLRAEAALTRLLTPAATICSSPARKEHWTLSPRERELLALVARGLTDKDIATALVISLATVRSHLDRIRDKTGRRRRPELTRLADELGLRVS